MTQWYVKELSQLTRVSVQTLHHYDRIGLLQPSVRLANGYRLYSEKDLLKLQQIIALKFFGFELAQIKTLLAEEVAMLDHFSAQSRFLEEKAKTLLLASDTLKNLIARYSHDKSIPWETIIQSIEVYRMTQELENTWLGKSLNPDELKEYAIFQEELKTRYTAKEKEACEKEWADLVCEINANLDHDPASELGIDIGKRAMKWVYNLYSNKHASLRMKVWEKGFKGEHDGEEKHGLSRTSIEWLDKAIYAYHSQRIFNILNMVETHPHPEVFSLWETLMMEMYGDMEAPKRELYQAVMQHEKTSQAIKNWLKKYYAM